MGGVYVTYVAAVDKGQCHVVRPVWSFKMFVKFYSNIIQDVCKVGWLLVVYTALKKEFFHSLR